MDAGKTHTASSIIAGLRRGGIPAAGIKLTGTAAGRDTWSMLDAGACAALDFIDGGHPSTYLLGIKDRKADLEEGMQQTLERIKKAAEGSA